MNPTRQLVWWGSGLLVLVLLLWLLRDILAPFVIGIAVAYVLDPVCDRLERLGLSRMWATIVVTLGFIVLVALVLGLVVPLLVTELIELAKQLPQYVDFARQRIAELATLLETEIHPELLDRVRQGVGGLQERLTSMLGSVASNILSGGVALFNLVSLLLITPIVAFYLLRDWDRLLAEGDKLLPTAYAETIREQLRRIDETLSGFVRGVGAVCLILACYYAAALTIAGLDFGIVIGIVAGLISFVPFLGAGLGLLFSVGTALVQFDGYLMVAVIAAIFLFGQFVEGNILQPTLVGERVGLHPVWVIFALLSGGAILGFLGVLIAVPAAAVIGVGVRFAVSLYRYRILGQGPDPMAASRQEET